MLSNGISYAYLRRMEGDHPSVIVTGFVWANLEFSLIQGHFSQKDDFGVWTVWSSIGWQISNRPVLNGAALLYDIGHRT